MRPRSDGRRPIRADGLYRSLAIETPIAQAVAVASKL